MNNKNKKIILISLVALLIILLAAIFFFSRSNFSSSSLYNNDEIEFLSDTQKEFYGLDKDTKAQAFYDEEGNLIYKIIKEDSDIVKDPVEAGLKAKVE